MALNHPSYKYAKKIVDGTLTNCYGKPTKAPKYVIKQARDFVDICDGKNKKYIIDRKTIKKIDAILKLLRMPLGFKAGTPLYECTTGYQWLFYVAVLCVVHRSDHKLRRYENAILEISRKNYKTYTIGTLFILLMLLEPKFSKFYSVAPDGALSKEVKDAIETTLKSSPDVYKDPEGNLRWTILRDYIRCDVTEIKYTPLNYANGRWDGRLASVWLADETAALPNNSAIESMRSGQLNITNKLGCIISTKYPSASNPFEDEVNYAKKVLDGLVDDDTSFALLYEPDDTKNWADNDLVLEQANPAALEYQSVWEDLVKKRKQAIEKEKGRENFLCKHCNIIYQGVATESYVSPDAVRECAVDKIDWTGREVFVGVDLSQTNDNTAVAMACLDEDENLLAEIKVFAPEGRIDEKTKFEKVDYKHFINKGQVIACGDMVIDYDTVERFVAGIEATYGCKVISVGYDRYNAISSAQKWEKEYGLQTVEVKQHSSVLHPATKFLQEKIESKAFKYETNDLLLINFQNARCVEDTNRNKYVNKKKSKGKIDMITALLDAVYLVLQDKTFNNDFVCQVI